MRHLAEKSILIFCILFSFLSISFCSDISISANVDKNSMSLDDQLILEVNVSGDVSNIPNPAISDLPNFNVYSSGRSQSISIVNGQMSSSVSFHYTLVPKSLGKFTIAPITLDYNGKTYSTQPIPVEVSQAGTYPAQASAKIGSVQSAQSNDNIKNLFVTASVDKNQAYVNEQIVFTFKFFRRVQLLSNPQYKAPDFTSFWKEDTPPKNYSTTVNGVQYLVSEVKTLLFPTKPGKFEIPSASLACNIEDFSRNDPFADDFFSGFFSTGKTQTLHTNPLAITAKPLPETDRPKDFAGAVGDYKISGSIDKNKSKVGEPLTLTLIVSGKGNVKTIPEPDFGEIPGFKKYETVSSMDIDSNQGILRGSKTFKTVLVPETPGKKMIKGLNFAFFNPLQNRYILEKTEPISLYIEPAEPGAVTPYTGLKSTTGEIKVINQDIEYLKSLKKWENYPGPLYKNTYFIILNIIPLISFIFSTFLIRRQEKISTDVSFARRLRASKTARKYLRQAKSLMNPEKSHDYYCALSKSLLEYIAHKLNVSADGLTLGYLEQALPEKNVSKETLSKVKKLLEECDMVRFSPAKVSQEMVIKNYKETEILIEKLEKELK